MTGEGSEYGSRKREGYREYEEEEDSSQEVRELIDEVEREQQESKDGQENREQTEKEEEEEYRKQVREMVEEAREAYAREVEEAESDEEREGHWNNEAEQCVKDAVKEIEREQEEDRKAREEAEEEYRQFQERGREERVESAEDDNLSVWEKDVLKNFEKYGVDPEEMRELWKEQFAKGVEDELEGPDDGRSLDEKKEGESDEEIGQGKTEDTESYHDDGSGQMYAMKSESKEWAESKTETETTEDTEKTEVESTEPSESASSKENTEQKNVQSEVDETAQSQEEEITEHQRNSSQESIEEPKASENLPKKGVETEYQEKETTTTTTAEYSEETEEKYEVTRTARKIESSDETEIVNEQETDASEEIETSMNQEIREKESIESESSDELTSEEEKWQRGLNELFNSLSEEFQEGIKDHLEEEIEDEESFEEHAKKHGLEDLLEDEEVMEEVRQFLRYRQARRANPEASAEELAEEFGIDAEQAEKWDDRNNYPEAVKKVLNLEGYRVLDNLARGFREQNYPSDWEEVEDYLQNNPRLEFEDPMALFEEWKREARAWTEITRMRRKGKIKIKLRNGRERYDREQIEGLSKNYGVSKEKIVVWLLGKYAPYLIVRTSREKSEHKQEDSSDFEIDGYTDIGRSNSILTPRKRGQRGTYNVNITSPIINGIRISSYTHFLEVLVREKPQLLHRKDIQKLLRYCEVFLNLIQEHQNKTTIHSYDISSISKRTGLSKTTIREWLTKGFVPRLFYLIERVPERFAKTPLRNLITDFEIKTTGIMTMDKMLDRLETLYIMKEIKQTKKRIKDSSDFFSIINALQNGTNSIEQVSKITNIPQKKVKYTLDRISVPHLVTLVSCIPREKPPPGWKWLPLFLTGSRMYNFIQVPVEIKTEKDLLHVLEQMESLNTPRMNGLEKQFGDVTPLHSFLYFLGLTISDGSFDRTKKGVLASERMILKLAKKYEWSLNAGKAYCHALGRIGFETSKGRDELTVRPDGSKSLMHVWKSKKSPFFVWAKKTLLGLNSSETKSTAGINLDWSLDMPRDWKISLLQGISDGDASASFQGQVLQIHTYTNQELYKRLLTSLGIISYSTATAVGIAEKKSIRLAEQLPMFRHASSRQSNISKLVQMLDSHNWSRITHEEEEFILNLHNQGYRVGEIIEELWEKFGRTRRRTTIYKLIERKNTGEKGAVKK